jgi:hypothetical protein
MWIYKLKLFNLDLMLLVSVVSVIMFIVIPNTRCFPIDQYTIKPAHEVTSIKRSPVLKGHFFSCPVMENFIWFEPLLRGHLTYEATFSSSQAWPLNTGLIIYVFTVLHTIERSKMNAMLPEMMANMLSLDVNVWVCLQYQDNVIRRYKWIHLESHNSLTQKHPWNHC